MALLWRHHKSPRTQAPTELADPLPEPVDPVKVEDPELEPDEPETEDEDQD